ncbi:hypothetical protein STCU_06046 [Strigomonas culicis]|nr:hypothetical protein STCU_06046 [Strigomonas culicis]|eukprot:EPY26852.1 hypothetical protein STCU_06046 [Strigomonas culicis]
MGDNASHPQLYNVPITALRTVGRDAEVMALWQNVLTGRHLQVLTGVDGVGKSTLAAEFCDCARRSQRFSCIQWFNGRHRLQSQVTHFFNSMRNRKEKDILLVLDDVPNVEEVTKLIPQHANLYTLVTTSQSDLKCDNQQHIVNTLPLSETTSVQILPELDRDPVIGEIFANLGQVPLLLHIASRLMESECASPTSLLSILQENQVMRDNTISISSALKILLDLSITHMEQEFPDARAQLAVLACFHLGDISDALVNAVVGEQSGAFSVLSADMGIFHLKWEDSAFALHASVAQVLRAPCTPQHLERAATCLASLWPKRWRGTGSHLAYNLVWHTYAVANHFAAFQVPLSPAMVVCMDKSASFLAHSEARDLEVAAEFWYRIHEQNAAAAETSKDAIRVGRECGRLLHYLRDARARGVLEKTYKWCTSYFGKVAPESSLVLGCLAPYLEAAPEMVDLLSESVAALLECANNPEGVYSKEEKQMALETAFVLTMCKGQMMKEMKMDVPDALWDSLQALDQQIKLLRR